MRTSTWLLIACCTSLLVACGADLPAAEAAPEPHLATTSAALVTVNRVVSNGANIDVTWLDELGQGYAMAVQACSMPSSSPALLASLPACSPPPASGR